MTIISSKTKTHHTALQPYCHHAKEEDYVEVVDWSNGEGKYVNISSQGVEQRLSLTYGEFQALSVLFQYESGEKL